MVKKQFNRDSYLESIQRVNYQEAAKHTALQSQHESTLRKLEEMEGRMIN